MKKIIIIDDEPKFVEPILEKIENQFGSNSYLYFQYPDEFFTAFERGDLKDIGCIIMDMLYTISDETIHNNSITGITIAKEFRKTDNNTPIAFYTVLNDINLINECKVIEGTEFIHKIDRYGFAKLFVFIKKHIA